MTADRVEVSWGDSKRQWVVRIEVGAEVIRRQCSEPKSADDQVLVAAAERTARDEGYDIAPANIVIRR